MKKILIISILGIGVFFTACDKEDECVQSDALGTYTGTKECDDTTAVNIVFEVTAGVSDIQIIIDGVPTIIEDCDIFGSDIVQGTGREIDGDIDGNIISFVETIKVNGQVDFRCVWEGLKN